MPDVCGHVIGVGGFLITSRFKSAGQEVKNTVVQPTSITTTRRKLIKRSQIPKPKKYIEGHKKNDTYDGVIL